MSDLQHAVCKRGFTVINMGYNTEVPDILEVHEDILYENEQSWKRGQNKTIDFKKQREYIVWVFRFIIN